MHWNSCTVQENEREFLLCHSCGLLCKVIAIIVVIVLIAHHLFSLRAAILNTKLHSHSPLLFCCQFQSRRNEHKTILNLQTHWLSLSAPQKLNNEINLADWSIACMKCFRLIDRLLVLHFQSAECRSAPLCPGSAEIMNMKMNSSSASPLWCGDRQKIMTLITIFYCPKLPRTIKFARTKDSRNEMQRLAKQKRMEAQHQWQFELGFVIQRRNYLPTRPRCAFWTTSSGRRGTHSEIRFLGMHCRHLHQRRTDESFALA